MNTTHISILRDSAEEQYLNPVLDVETIPEGIERNNTRGSSKSEYPNSPASDRNSIAIELHNSVQKNQVGAKSGNALQSQMV